MKNQSFKNNIQSRTAHKTTIRSNFKKTSAIFAPLLDLVSKRHHYSVERTLKEKDMTFTYKYDRGATTVDCIVFDVDDEDLKVLLIQRDADPFENCWALPGGFLEMNETLDEAARRELLEETGLKTDYLEQLYTFSTVNRDPRERVITVAYYALVNLRDHQIEAASDARDAAWFSLHDLPDLAFDHDEILEVAHERLRGKLRYQPIGFELLPEKFTLRQLQHLYEVILDRELDKRNFRKKVKSLNILKELKEWEQDVSHRAARLYKFDNKKYERQIKRGFHFEI